MADGGMADEAWQVDAWGKWSETEVAYMLHHPYQALQLMVSMHQEVLQHHFHALHGSNCTELFL